MLSFDLKGQPQFDTFPLGFRNNLCSSSAWLYSWQRQEDTESIYSVEKFLHRSNIHVAPCRI